MTIVGDMSSCPDFISDGDIATTGCLDPHKNSFERASNTLLKTRLHKNSLQRKACYLSTYASCLSRLYTDRFQSHKPPFTSKRRHALMCNEISGVYDNGIGKYTFSHYVKIYLPLIHCL